MTRSVVAVYTNSMKKKSEKLIRINICLPEWAHDVIKSGAANEGLSTSALLRHAALEYVRARQPEAR